VWNGDTLIATIDQPLFNGAATGTAATRYIHPDHLGSTNIVSDTSGAIAQDVEYYPYGETRLNQSTYPTNEKRQWIGQFLDTSNLEYLQARYYSPTQGQFTSEDPAFWNPSQLDDPQQLNAYAYGRDNPITRLDASGLDSAYFAIKSIGNGIPWTHLQDARIQDFVGAVGGEHNYVDFNIDTAAGLKELNIPGVQSQNGEATFTISFEPSDPSGSNSTLMMQLSADLADAQNYHGSKGSQPISAKDYAKLANDMYLLGSIISSEKLPYRPAPELQGGYNSNSAIFTLATLTGLSSTFNSLQGSMRPGNLPAGNSKSVPMGGGTFIGTYNFGNGASYNFGTQSWSTSGASTPQSGSIHP
jgi:RHS repeat-associated protein